MTPISRTGNWTQLHSKLWHLNVDFTLAFEEYVTMKVGIPKLAQIFLKNKTMRYLAKAAPGIQEMVLLGKIWYERDHYDQVIVDMPSTGYGLAMFQSTDNFIKLFRAGPLYQDAAAMMKNFGDPKSSGHLILSLPEEMPLRESVELRDFLAQLFPENPAVFLANRVFPTVRDTHLQNAQLKDADTPQSWPRPLAHSREEYIYKRYCLEKYNLRLWREAKISFEELAYLVPTLLESPESMSERLAELLQTKAYL